MTPNKEKYFGKSSESTTINAKLDLVDALLPRIDGNPSPFVEKIFEQMDDIFFQVKDFRENNIEMDKLGTQLNYVTNRIYSSASVLVKSFGGDKVLAETRQKRGVPEERWWWYLDHYLKEKRKQSFRRAGILGLVAVVVIAIMVLLYNQFIAPPAEVR